MDKGNADTTRNPTPPARRQRPTGALLPPSFEPRPLFLSGRGSKLGTPTAAQKQPTCRASGSAEAGRGGCSASQPPQKPGKTPPPNDKTYVACGAITNEHSGKFPNPNKREKARSTRRLGLSCRRSLVSTRAEIDPKFTKKPLQPASPNREDNQRQPVGSRDFVGNGIENDPA